MSENTHTLQKWLTMDAEIRQQCGKRVEKKCFTP